MKLSHTVRNIGNMENRNTHLVSYRLCIFYTDTHLIIEFTIK